MQQALALEGMVERLDARSRALLQGARMYSHGLSGMTEGLAAMAARLYDFCDGTDEETMSLGAPRHSCAQAQHRRGVRLGGVCLEQFTPGGLCTYRAEHRGLLCSIAAWPSPPGSAERGQESMCSMCAAVPCCGLQGGPAVASARRPLRSAGCARTLLAAGRNTLVGMSRSGPPWSAPLAAAHLVGAAACARALTAGWRARAPGGPQLAKFVGVLQELRDAGEMLHTQTEAALCERLEPWAAVRVSGRGPRRRRRGLAAPHGA